MDVASRPGGRETRRNPAHADTSSDLACGVLWQPGTQKTRPATCGTTALRDHGQADGSVARTVGRIRVIPWCRGVDRVSRDASSNDEDGRPSIQHPRWR